MTMKICWEGRRMQEIKKQRPSSGAWTRESKKAKGICLSLIVRSEGERILKPAFHGDSSRRKCPEEKTETAGQSTRTQLPKRERNRHLERKLALDSWYVESRIRLSKSGKGPEYRLGKMRKKEKG